METVNEGKKESNPTFQQEFALKTRGYVYHPNMLSMKIGGSVLYDQSKFETLDGDSSTDSQRTNVFAFLDFLEKKPYPLTLYFDQQNPSVSTGLNGRFIQENTRYGFDFSLLEPFSPIQITVGAFQLTSQGEGLDQVVDDIQKQSNIRLYHAYGIGNFAQLSHQVNDFESRSGSLGLPIESRSFITESSVFNSRNVFGENNKFKLTNNITYSTQDELPDRKDLRFNPNLTWQHSEYVNSFYRYDFSETNEEVQDAKNHKLAVGAAKTGKDFSASFDVHATDNETTSETTRLEFQNYGGNFSISYLKPVSAGDLRLSYAGAYDQNNQETDTNNALLKVFDEEHVLTGTTAQTLVRDFIDVGTITVTNITRTQTFVLGLDYNLIIIGSTVQIQRRAGGNIIDGQTVLVNYDYATGGTFNYDTISQNLNLNLSFARYYNLYVRYFNKNQQLQEGDPTITLNSVSRSTVGIRADRPLQNGITLGGEFVYEDNNEDNNDINTEDTSSYIKQNYDAFIELPLPRLTDVRFSARRVLVDNENSLEDVDLNSYILRINAQPWLRTRLSFESSYENDTGSAIDRLLRSHRLQADWRVRQLSVSFLAHYSVEELADTERERWTVKFVARREFN